MSESDIELIQRAFSAAVTLVLLGRLLLHGSMSQFTIYDIGVMVALALAGVVVAVQREIGWPVLLLLCFGVALVGLDAAGRFPRHKPILVVRNGLFLEVEARRMGLTEDRLLDYIQKAGLGGLDDVQFVLITDGETLLIHGKDGRLRTMILGDN